MTTGPIQSSSPVAQSQHTQAAAPARSTAKQDSTLPQDTVTLSAAAKAQQAPAVAKDPPPKAASSSDGDHDGH
jgi:hypothetical protein